MKDMRVVIGAGCGGHMCVIAETRSKTRPTAMRVYDKSSLELLEVYPVNILPARILAIKKWRTITVLVLSSHLLLLNPKGESFAKYRLPLSNPQGCVVTGRQNEYLVVWSRCEYVVLAANSMDVERKKTQESRVTDVP